MDFIHGEIIICVLSCVSSPPLVISYHARCLVRISFEPPFLTHQLLLKLMENWKSPWFFVFLLFLRDY